MATVVQCNRCCVVAPYDKFMHIHVHELLSETTTTKAHKEAYDLCPKCYKKFKALMKEPTEEQNDNTETT